MLICVESMQRILAEELEIGCLVGLSGQAYKRVGPMVHSADIGRGIIGVMDITDIMVRMVQCENV